MSVDIRLSDLINLLSNVKNFPTNNNLHCVNLFSWLNHFCTFFAYLFADFTFFPGILFLSAHFCAVLLKF